MGIHYFLRLVHQFTIGYCTVAFMVRKKATQGGGGGGIVVALIDLYTVSIIL